MTVSIHPIKLGVDCCYVIQGDRTIMIDAGSPRQATRFRKAMKTLTIDPRSIRLIVITLFLPLVRFPATNVDVVLGDGELFLGDYGIPGKIIYTPGHSMGSVSVLLETGDAFVGDLAMNAFPLRLSPGLPIFAEDVQKVKESWRRLLDEGAKTVYPAHGKPFAAEVIRRVLL